MLRSILVMVVLGCLPALASADSCDGREYLRRRPDVQAAGMNPWEHWVSYGRYEGTCSPINEYRCSEGQYFAERPDVQAAGMSAYDHYNAYGRFEGMCKVLAPAAPVQNYMCTYINYGGRTIEIATMRGNHFGRGLNNGEYFYSSGLVYCYNNVVYITGTNF